MAFMVENEFDLGGIVYLKTDPDQYKRIVIAMQIMANGTIVYNLSFGMESNWFQSCEISKEKNLEYTNADR